MSEAAFYGHIVDETTDISAANQMSVIFRYLKEGKVVERFWGFFNVTGDNGNLIIPSYTCPSILAQFERLSTAVIEFKAYLLLHCIRYLYVPYI